MRFLHCPASWMTRVESVNGVNAMNVQVWIELIVILLRVIAAGQAG